MKHIILANWKASPTTVKEATALFNSTKLAVSKMRSVEVILAPPAVYIESMASKYRGNKINFCAQAISTYEDVAHTGALSATHFKSVGATYALIGHSEIGDSIDDLRIKTFLAIKYGLTPIVFVGEGSRDLSASYLGVIKEQIQAALKELSESQVQTVIFCYEPVWAVGQAEAMDSYDVHQMMLYLRKVLLDEYGAAMARKSIMLYGGSVNTGNIKDLLEIDDLDGVAVGRASTDAGAFTELLGVANKV